MRRDHLLERRREAKITASEGKGVQGEKGQPTQTKRGPLYDQGVRPFSSARGQGESCFS